FAGTLLFVASDSLLAVNRFVYDLGDLAPILVLGTYYPAQWLIAQSAGRKHM
ncbi:MAG: lysoplasmalogenase family protein, partial [Candidatus Promineifilaceae bacterium]